jgi:hypothetical protein
MDLHEYFRDSISLYFKLVELLRIHSDLDEYILNLFENMHTAALCCKLQRCQTVAHCPGHCRIAAHCRAPCRILPLAQAHTAALPQTVTDCHARCHALPHTAAL